MSEIDRIKEQYARRKTGIPPDLYSFERDDVFLGSLCVDRVTRDMLRRCNVPSYQEARLLEVGCGSGGNLLRFLRWGFLPENLEGNELLPERADAARNRLPGAVNISTCDIRDLEAGQYDVVYQSTVLSSILTDRLQKEIADKMWEMTCPGGVVVSYDLAYNNPRNHDVRGVTRQRLRQLFPLGCMRYKRVTLAPPIARRVADMRPVYTILNGLIPLRSHLLTVIEKS